MQSCKPLCETELADSLCYSVQKVKDLDSELIRTTASSLALSPCLCHSLPIRRVALGVERSAGINDHWLTNWAGKQAIQQPLPVPKAANPQAFRISPVRKAALGPRHSWAGLLKAPHQAFRSLWKSRLNSHPPALSEMTSVSSASMVTRPSAIACSETVSRLAQLQRD